MESRIWNFISYFYTKYRIVLFILGIVMIGGYLSYTSFLKREGFPEINFPISAVTIDYAVNDRNKVIVDAVEPIENTILENDDISSVKTFVNPNGATVIANLKDGVDSEKFSDDFISKILSEDLPEDVDVDKLELSATKYFGEYDILLALSSSDFNDEDLTSQSSIYAKELSKLDLVSDAEVIDNYRERLNVVTGEIEQIQRFQPRSGVTVANELKLENAVYVGVKALNDNTDLIKLSDSIKELEEQRSDKELESINISYVGDSSVFVKEDIASLQKNILGGLIGVSIILYLLISWRASLVGFIFVPLVMAGTFLTLLLTGESLNVISLFGLVLVLGLFVDDAIVIIESIDQEKQKGKTRTEAIKAAVKQIGIADVLGTTTTLLVFVPMFFISGTLGEFITLIPKTVSIALLVSLASAFIIVPLFGDMLIRKKASSYANIAASLIYINLIATLASVVNDNWLFLLVTLGISILVVAAGIIIRDWLKLTTPEAITKVINSPSIAIGKVAQSISDLIVWAYKVRVRSIISVILTIVFAGGLLFSSQMAFANIKFSIFGSPKDTTELGIFYTLEVIDRTKTSQENISINTDIAKRIETVVKETQEKYIKEISYIGQETIGIQNNGFMIYVLLTDMDTRDIKSPEIVENLREDVSELGLGDQITIDLISAGPPVGDFPFSMQIFGDTAQSRELAAQEIQKFLNDLDELEVQGATEEIIETKIGDSFIISRTDGKSLVEISAKYSDNENSGLIPETQNLVEQEFTIEKLEELGLEDVTLGFDAGQATENQESFASAGAALFFALAFMYALLMVRYNSYSQPILVFLSIVLSIPGVIWGLSVTDNAFGFFTGIGFMGLAGIVVNNSIMLLDYAKSLREEGLKPSEAIAEAVRLRFRPIISTSCTTIIGLLPLALNDPFWEGLSFTMIFGVISSAILINFVLPGFYVFNETIRDLMTRGFKKVFKIQE